MAAQFHSGDQSVPFEILTAVSAVNGIQPYLLIPNSLVTLLGAVVELSY